MFQKFYTDTLASRFIKSLLAQTSIPLFDAVVDGDYLIAGRFYVYKKFIIQCASNGYLNTSSVDNLYPSDKLYPSNKLFPGTPILHMATFYVRSYIYENSVKTHSAFKSSTNYYDSETHYHLGKYLRYLYSTTGLNLFPFYNCYNSKYFSDVELAQAKSDSYSDLVSITRVSKQQYKVVAIPIQLGKTYTIAIDCPTQVLMRACIHDDSGFVESINENKVFDNSSKIFTHMSFRSPVKYKMIDPDYITDASEIIMQQHNLYLLIQLPLNNDSSIVVLENLGSTSGIRCNENSVREPNSILYSSLLSMNTRNSYAFSDRLLEYLLGNIILKQENVSYNIMNVQTALCKQFPEYNRLFINGTYKKGVWNDDIPRLITSLIEDYSKHNIIYDQDGNINKDTEALIYRTGGSY